jgi:rod shape-determining protein MreC
VLRISRKALLIFIVITLIFVVRPSLFTSSRKILFEIVIYPLKVVNGIKTAFKSRTRSVRENYMLKEKAAEMALEITRMKSLEKENERLRAALKLKSRLAYKSIGAQVIGRIPSSWIRSVLINKGQRQGIKRRMACATVNGLVGTVVETGPLSSKVMLINDPNSRIGVILGDCRETGILVGTQTGGCKVIYLEMDSQVKPKEKVYTSNIGGFFPEGIESGKLNP